MNTRRQHELQQFTLEHRLRNSQRESYFSQNDLRVHFGLVRARTIDKLEIHWPSGKVEQLTSLPADHYYSVVEGKGIVDSTRARPSPIERAAAAQVSKVRNQK